MSSSQTGDARCWTHILPEYLAYLFLILFYPFTETKTMRFEKPFRCRFVSCAACHSLSIDCPPRGVRTVIEGISTQRTSALVTARKPLEQAARMEEVLAGLAALIRHLLI